jgi:SAM-dependent methyltransferase
VPFDRVEVLRHGIPAAPARVVEIGPLDNPILPKPRYAAVYVDYTDAAALRHKYADDTSRRGQIVEVDVLWNGNSPLAQVLGDAVPVEAVVASHVIEHVPDPIRWLSHLASVLRPGGVVSLAIPDMRFTFDVNRRLSEFGDLLDAYLRQAVVPSYAQQFDYHTKAVPVDAVALWEGTADYRGTTRPGDLRREAFDGCLALSRGGGYVDVHCHTFTPASFVDLVETLGEFELIDFAIDDLRPTRRGAWEFYVRLTRLDPDQPAPDRRTGIEHARQVLADAPAPAVAPTADATAPVAPPGTSWQLVTTTELRVLQAKKKARTLARALARKVLTTLRNRQRH